MDRSKEYNEGGGAYCLGATLLENPYHLGSNEWCEWEEGWLDNAYPNRDNRMGTAEPI